MAFKLMITKKSEKYTDKIQITDDKPMGAKELKELILAILEIEDKQKSVEVDHDLEVQLQKIRRTELAKAAQGLVQSEEFKQPTLNDYPMGRIPVKIKETQEPVKSRPRAVELIGSERSSFSISDKFPKNQGPDAKTVKAPPEDSGMVNVYVECRECGFGDIQQTYDVNKYVKCDQCRARLFLEPAGKVKGELDAAGNYFVAKNKLLTARERWEHKNSQKG